MEQWTLLAHLGLFLFGPLLGPLSVPLRGFSPLLLAPCGSLAFLVALFGLLGTYCNASVLSLIE